jgi:ABC-2 type transport system ATP-binding protein
LICFDDEFVWISGTFPMEVIRLEQVSLWRRTQEEFSYDLKRTILSIIEGKYRQPPKKLILDQINLAVDAGTKLGIVGANGSGKSTLLKLICKILQPTSGQVCVQGNIAPLIELDAGFDPGLSVVENIILYGVLLGFTQARMKTRVKDILAFSELADFALMPLKGLSSGMVARLGFAIATDVQPEILILDEVLSVGDESFQQKCKQRIGQFWEGQTTVLVVSHDMSLIRDFCDQAIWLDRGQIRSAGPATAIVEEYLTAVRQGLRIGLSP